MVESKFINFNQYIPLDVSQLLAELRSSWSAPERLLGEIPWLGRGNFQTFDLAAIRGNLTEAAAQNVATNGGFRPYIADDQNITVIQRYQLVPLRVPLPNISLN